MVIIICSGSPNAQAEKVRGFEKRRRKETVVEETEVDANVEEGNNPYVCLSLASSARSFFFFRIKLISLR